jgi:5-methylcytosine-specific restriction endonuclease McrA
VLVLHRDPLCRGCEREPSRQADHVVPLKCGGTWDIENGQGLCDSCHSYKTAVEQRDPFFGLRLREAGKATGESAPSGWRKDPAFCRDAA